MSDYQQQNNFAAKDAINAPVVGEEFQNEFDEIQRAVNSKADKAGATFTGELLYDTGNTPIDGSNPQEVVNVEYTTNGTANIDAASVVANTVESRNQVTAKTGSPSPNNNNNAGYVFSGDNDSGLFNPTDGELGLVINGVTKVQTTSTQIRVKDDLVAEQTVFFSNGQLVLQGTGRIQGVDTVSAGSDATNKSYVDGRFNTLRTHNSVGSFVFARRLGVNDLISPNQTVSGSSLRTTGVPVRIGGDANQTSSGGGNSLSGTWRALGSVTAAANDRYPATLWVRIS